MMYRALCFCLGLAVAGLPLIAGADDAPAAIPVPATKASTTHHTLAIGGTTWHYTAIAGRTLLHDATGQPTAAMFSVSYLLDGAAARSRPVTFLWNGGPGSATVWLHMGSFGPLRVPLNDTGVVVPPGQLIANDDTLLPTTDLVFVDAPGTGFSKIVGKAHPADFYGIDQDAKAFTQFIENWLSANGRWDSPKFIIGESYGTTRAANVVNRLQNDGVGMNGVALIGSALDLTALGGITDDPRSCLAFLPTEAAVAWYHDALPGPGPKPPREAFLRDVRAFAAGEYATALIQGDQLAPDRMHRIAEQVHAYIGLDTAYVERELLCVDPGHFEKELERERGIVLGRYDGRFQGPDINQNGEYPNYDPTVEDVIQDAFVSQLNGYLRQSLHFAETDVYLPFGDGVNGSWNFTRDHDRPSNASIFPDVLPDLGLALIHNPALRVFSANGEFDLATPFFGTELAIHQIGLPPAIRPHVTFGYYPSGHMIYLENASRHQLSADLTAFMHGALDR
jgi:carboxypeptidase C (cathepsin A)